MQRDYFLVEACRSGRLLTCSWVLMVLVEELLCLSSWYLPLSETAPSASLSYSESSLSLWFLKSVQSSTAERKLSTLKLLK